MSDRATWAGWVSAARGGDEGAREQLFEYFTGFVHGVLACRLPLRVANGQVRAVMEEVLRGGGAPAEYGAQVLAEARRRAASVELPIADEPALEKVRALGEPGRERLMLRLLEGIPGPEIAEASGEPHGEVRSGLERAFAQAFGPEGSGDTYLWSLTGAPHAAVVRLENELSSLRYDPSGPVAPLAVAKTDDVTKSGAALQVPVPVEEKTSPIGKPLDDVTQSGPALVTPEPAVENPFAVEAATKQATELPVEAQVNPFVAQPQTVPASDLPIAAQVSPIAVAAPVAPLPRALEEAPSAEQSLQPLTADIRRGVADEPTSPRGAPLKKPDDDATSPRGVPLTMLARGWQPEVPAPRPSAKRDWHVPTGAPLEGPQPKVPFSLTRGTTPFVAALVLFIFCGVVGTVALRAVERDVKKPWNLVPIVVARTNIAEGTELTLEQLSVRQVPEQFVTSSIVKPEAFRYVTGQRIMVPVQAGDPLMWSEFQSHRTEDVLSHRVLKRGRAYTIEGADVVGVGGFIHPGDHVDLIVTVSEHSATTLQNLIVLATGKVSPKNDLATLSNEEREYCNVTVLALPEEAQVLALTRERATYWMVLRNEGDFDTVATKPAGFGTLLSGAHSAAYAASREPALRFPKLEVKRPPAWGLNQKAYRVR
jgi:pilus assembly protein CpaB